MNTKKLFYITLVISVFIQIITGIIDFLAFLIKVPSQFIIIRQLLILELSVQFVEGLFYLWLVINFNYLTDVTPKRYIDWTITTPTMLVTLIIYLIYSYHKEKGDTSKLELFDLLFKNSFTISNVLMLNWLMLLFGYLGEKKIIPTFTGVLLGFIPFLIYYFIIYINYVRSTFGLKLFLYFLVFWSFYGVVALFPYYLKNACYNILDIFSKNFFGIFLGYTIISKNF
jgi:hypothetical protein